MSDVNSNNKLNLHKNNTKGFSTALLLNVSPLENNKEFNEPIENNRLNISANALQSDSNMKDFLSLDLLEKIDSISPFEKNKENKNKLNEKNFELNKICSKSNSFSLNSSGSVNEDESIEIIDNEEKKPILNTMKKINEENQYNIKNKNDNINFNNISNVNNNINLYFPIDYKNKNIILNSINNNLINNSSFNPNVSNNYNINNHPNNLYQNFKFNNIYNFNNNNSNNFSLYQSNQNKINKKQIKKLKINDNNNINNNGYNNNYNYNINKNNKNENSNEQNQKKIKESDYIIEMFGRVGWICEQCNNFNYDTRNKCNRCGIQKLPKKISKMKRKNQKIKNEQEKLKEKEKKENHNHKNNILKERKGDWICAKCANLNFSFRVFCNCCNFSKIESEKLMKQSNYNIMNLGNINFNILGNYFLNNYQNNNMQLINNGNIFFNNYPQNFNYINNNDYNDILNKNINNYNNNLFYNNNNI